MGLITQEVEDIIPEVVREKTMPLMDKEDTLYKTVDYKKLVAVLIEAIKELKKEVDNLKENK